MLDDNNLRMKKLVKITLLLIVLFIGSTIVIAQNNKTPNKNRSKSPVSTQTIIYEDEFNNTTVRFILSDSTEVLGRYNVYMRFKDNFPVKLNFALKWYSHVFMLNYPRAGVFESEKDKDPKNAAMKFSDMFYNTKGVLSSEVTFKR